MSQQPAMEYDVIGIGFGPSNLSLAIALDERTRGSRTRYEPLFIEKYPRFTWHGGMLLPGADMQISFLKDLVSLRDPTSPYTFVNYLHKHGRLESFINCRTFYPSRVEFNDYLRWVAADFDDVAAYSETVTAVEPVSAGKVVTALRVHSRNHDGKETIRLAKDLVIGAGGVAHVPSIFMSVSGDARVIHSSFYLDRVEAMKSCRRIAVVGGGQSAAEVTVDLASRFPDVGVDLVFRSHALKPSDSSPFVNEIFNPEYTDFVFDQPEERRQAIVRAFRNTNYAVVDSDLLDQLYRMLYQQRLGGKSRISLRPRSDIKAVTAAADGVELEVVDTFAEHGLRRKYDAVILATGYDRDAPLSVLSPIQSYIESNALDRTYRLHTAPSFRPHIYLQGYSESSHGLSDTLLSVVAVRSQEIAQSLLHTVARRELMAYG